MGTALHCVSTDDLVGSQNKKKANKTKQKQKKTAHDNNHAHAGWIPAIHSIHHVHHAIGLHKFRFDSMI